MNVQIQGGGKNSGVYANTGSSAALVEYLMHEDAERLAAGLEILPFFNAMGIEVSGGEVIQKLDRNHKKLHYEDAKFFHLDLNPSENELRAMGTTDEEIIEGCKKYALAMSQAYADNFNKKVEIGQDENGNPITRPLSAEDLMLFWKIHINRGEKEGLQVHIHGVPSRKDIHNKLQLSPKTNHRGTKEGPVKGGFERTAYYKKAEEVFDEMFGYNRAFTETFEYYLAQKRGEELKESQKAQITPEIEKKEQSHKMDVLLSRTDKEEVSRKADEIRPETSNKIQEALAKREQRRRNEFWNDYHSKYRPEYNRLKDACDKSFNLYKTAKENYGVCSAAITEKYNNLRNVYSQMNALQDDVQKASNAKGVVKAVSALVFCINPVAGIVMDLVGGIIAEAERSAAIAARKDLRAQAAAIKDSIESLKAEQAALRQDKADRLKIYIENKEAKTALQTEINNLREKLQRPIEEKPKIKFNFMDAMNQQPSMAEAERKVENAPGIDIFNIMKRATSKQTLELDLLARKVVINPVRDRYNGVLDFKVILAQESRVVEASSLVPGDQMLQILDKWEELTGEQPAYRLEIQRDNYKKLVDICAKMDAASPGNAPRIPQKILFLPGGEIKVFYYNSGRGEFQNIIINTNGKMKFNGLILDINTGKYTQLQTPRQTQNLYQGESQGEGKGHSRGI